VPLDASESGPNKHSLDDSEQAKRLQKWLHNMKFFKLFNSDRLPSPVHDNYKMYAIIFENLSQVIKVPEIPNYSSDRLAVTVQLNCTLCDPQVGLFGRTCMVKSGGQEVDEKD